MAKSKSTSTRKKTEIRINDPEKKVYEVVSRLADEEKRTISKQAEYMLARYIEQNKL
jgi:hypothetical protein